ncbi:MAG: PTS sugar transporter subunit IIB [Erysipelotrichaceae bacterium]|nr:PTS sugar transporter subunit IIB [Erysipelotrichaceae bacterium]
MLNIVLLCQYGASTGLVADKIVEAANKRGIEAVVNAYSVSEAAKVIPTADIVLLGPQVRFHQKNLEKAHGHHGVPIVPMQPVDYGRLNGEGILNTALEVLEKK